MIWCCYQWKCSFCGTSRKVFPEASRGGWGLMESSMDYAKSRGFLSKVSFLSILPWKKSNLMFSRARIKATANSFCSILKYSPILNLASLACIPSCSSQLWVRVAGPWPCSCLKLHGYWERRGEHIGECGSQSKRGQVRTRRRGILWGLLTKVFMLARAPPS